MVVLAVMGLAGRVVQAAVVPAEPADYTAEAGRTGFVVA